MLCSRHLYFQQRAEWGERQSLHSRATCTEAKIRIWYNCCVDAVTRSAVMAIRGNRSASNRNPDANIELGYSEGRLGV